MVSDAKYAGIISLGLDTEANSISNMALCDWDYYCDYKLKQTDFLIIYSRKDTGLLTAMVTAIRRITAIKGVNHMAFM